MMDRNSITFLWALLLIVQPFQCDAFQTGLPPAVLSRPSLLHRQLPSSSSTCSFLKVTHRSSWRRVSNRASTLSVVQALPTCVASNVHTVALVAGVTGLFCQVALTKCFEQSKLFKKHAAYTAHNTIALALMLLVSGIGIAGWWGMDTPLTAVDRLLGGADACRWLASIVTGLILLWDVPVSLAIPALRKPDVIIHHVVMAVVAYVGAAYLPMYYLYFYLGVSEISSIPLIVYDQLRVLSSIAPATDDDEIDDNSSSIKAAGSAEKRVRITTAVLRDQVQIVAAIAFTMIRAILFTKVTVLRFLPDVLSVLSTAAGGNALRFGGVASLGFTALQLFWFSKMVRIMLLNGGKEEESTPNELVATAD